MHTQTERDPRSLSRISAMAERRVCALAGGNGVLRRAKPPQRLPETVERLRCFRLTKRFLERVTGNDPVTSP